MVRTQVRLTEAQRKALRLFSAATGQSAAEVIRTALDEHLRQTPAGKTEDRIARALRVAGKYSSGKHDVSTRHDEHLAEAYRQ